MNPGTGRRWLSLGLLSLAAVVAGGFLLGRPTMGSPSGPCDDLAPGSIIESQDFTPAEQQRGRRPERAITGRGPGMTPLPRGRQVPWLVDWRPLQYAVGSSTRGLYLYYLSAPLAPDMTRSDFLIAGGVLYGIQPLNRGEPFAPAFIAEVGDCATPVEVGAHAGALVWEDPTEFNVRAHGLYWADGASNYSLVAVRGPGDLVNLGRGLVCGFHW